MPNWEGSDRGDRLPSDWPAIRRRILMRDGHRCQHVRVDTDRKCGAHATECDHKDRGDDHRDANLQALCTFHHAKKSGREGGIASGVARRKSAAARKPKHPGVI